MTNFVWGIIWTSLIVPIITEKKSKSLIDKNTSSAKKINEEIDYNLDKTEIKNYKTA